MAVEQTDAMVLFKFFGVKDGQTKMEFVKETRELSDEDRAILANGIRDESFTY